MPEKTTEPTITLTIPAQDAKILANFVDNHPDNTTLGDANNPLNRTVQLIWHRANDALKREELLARVPRVIPELTVGASLLWEKDYEMEDGQIGYKTSELVIEEIIFQTVHPKHSEIQSAIVRLTYMVEGYRYLFLTRFPRGWAASALVHTLEQAMQSIPESLKTPDEIHAYLIARVNHIADAEGISIEEKKAQVKSILTGDLIQRCATSKLNLIRDIRLKAYSHHLV